MNPFPNRQGTVRTTAQGHRWHCERFTLRVIGLFAILGAVLAVVAVQVYRTVGSLVQANEWISHTHQVEDGIVGAVAALRDAEAAQRAYIIGGDTTRMVEVYAALPRIAERMARLKELVTDNPAQIGESGRLEAVLDLRRDSIGQSLAIYRKNDVQGVQSNPQFAKGREQDALVDTLAARMIASEQRLLVQRKASGKAIARQTRLLTTSAVLLCLGVLALALILILREQRRRLAGERRVIASNGELAQSLDASRRLGDTLTRLSDLGHMLQGCRSLDEAALGLTAAMSRLFPDSSGAINLMNASQNLITPISSWGEPVGTDPVFTPDECWALRLGHAYPEESATATFNCKHLQGDVGRDARAHLCVPLFAQGASLGTLLLSQAAPLDLEARHAAVAAAEQVSLAIANLRLQETLRTQSLRDALTGLFNRRYLEVSLARDLTRAIRRSQPLAVLMLDVDHFKRFNDNHGHDAGDTLLAQLGELLAALVRNEDVACRYGGEEFTIVMQEADAALALDRAEDIRRHVAAMQVLHRQQNLGRVTVSIGIASYPQQGDSPEQLLRRADRALYIAKKNGRDQVRVADRA